MKKLILFSLITIGIGSNIQAQSGSPNCQFTYELTNRTTEPTDGITNIALSGGAARTPSINNRAQQCNSWYMSVAVDGLSAVSMTLDDSQNSYTTAGGTPLAWNSWQGTILSGALPITTTTSYQLAVTGYYPWISVNVASSTGTGSVYVTLYGWKTPSLLGANTINGTLCFISGTCSPPNATLNVQGPLSPVVMTGSDVTLFTYTLPANTLQAGSCINIVWMVRHTTGVSTTTLKLFFGATSSTYTNTSTDTNLWYSPIDTKICNNSGVTNVQTWIIAPWLIGTAWNTVNSTPLSSAIDTTAAVVVKLTANATAADQVTPYFWAVR